MLSVSAGSGTPPRRGEYSVWGRARSAGMRRHMRRFEKRSVGLLRGITGDDYLVLTGSGYITVTNDNAVLTLFRLPFPRERGAVTT